MVQPHLRYPIYLSIGAAVATLVLKGIAYRLTNSVGLLSDAAESHEPELRVLQRPEEIGRREVLRLRVERDETGEIRARGDEAHVPERDDAGVADEHVEGDDDADHDERCLELDAVRAADAARDSGRDDDERDRPEGRLKGMSTLASKTAMSCSGIRARRLR